MVFMFVVGLLVGACCWLSSVGGAVFAREARGGWVGGVSLLVRMGGEGGWVFVMVVS